MKRAINMIIKESINMRFTQGYWVIRQDYVMSYATQTVRVIKNDKELHIISACRPIPPRRYSRRRLA